MRRFVKCYHENRCFSFHSSDWIHSTTFKWGISFAFDEYTGLKSNRWIYGSKFISGESKQFKQMRNNLVNNLHLIDCCAKSWAPYMRTEPMKIYMLRFDTSTKMCDININSFGFSVVTSLVQANSQAYFRKKQRGSERIFIEDTMNCYHS